MICRILTAVHTWLGKRLAETHAPAKRKSCCSFDGPGVPRLQSPEDPEVVEWHRAHFRRNGRLLP